MVILTKYIAKHEFKPLRRFFTLDDILEGARKVLKNLAIETKPPRSIPEVKFFKVRIGRKIKGRMIVILMIHKQKIVPLLIRLKKDKIFGINMAMNNPQVTEQLNKNLDRVIEDINYKRFEEFPLE